MFPTCPSIRACARAGCGQRHHLTVLPSTQLVCNFASLHILSINQFIKQQRTKGHLQVASIYNIYSVQSTDGVYNMYTLHPVSILTFRPQLQRLVLCVCRHAEEKIGGLSLEVIVLIAVSVVLLVIIVIVGVVVVVFLVRKRRRKLEGDT